MNATVTDCGLHEPFLESLAGSEEENQRVAAQAGLLILRVVDRFSNPDCRTEIESIRYQIEAARSFVARDALETVVQDLLDEALAAAGRVLTTGSTEVIFSPLIDYGRWLEGNLQLDEAIEVYDTLLAVGGMPDNHALVLCWRGRALRIAGKLDVSISEYRRAGKIAEATDNRSVQLRSRLGVAMGLKQKGNLPRAEEVARKVVHDARRWGDRHHEAEALHVLGAGLALMDRDPESIPLLFESYHLHQEEGTRACVMSDIGYSFKKLRRYEAALHAFSVALPGLRIAAARMNTTLELLEVESLRGNRESFEKYREEVERMRDRLPPDVEADFYTKLGQGLCLFGDEKSGAEYLRRAMLVAERAALNTKYFDAERKLVELTRTVRYQDPSATLDTNEVMHPELDKVERSLAVLHHEGL